MRRLFNVVLLLLLSISFLGMSSKSLEYNSKHTQPCQIQIHKEVKAQSLGTAELNYSKCEHKGGQHRCGECGPSCCQVSSIGLIVNVETIPTVMPEVEVFSNFLFATKNYQKNLFRPPIS